MKEMGEEMARAQLTEKIVEAVQTVPRMLREKETFEGGSTRSVKQERYDIIPPEALSALARRYGLGAVKHGEGNWKHGGVAFIKATFNHLLAHITDLMAGNADDEGDHTDAIIWNASALCWFKERKQKEWEQALTELQEGLVEKVREVPRGNCIFHNLPLIDTSYCAECLKNGSYDPEPDSTEADYQIGTECPNCKHPWGWHNLVISEDMVGCGIVANGIACGCQRTADEQWNPGRCVK